MGDFTQAEVAALKALAAGLINASSGGGAASSSGAGGEASDAECLGQYGDPTVRKDPKRWAGDSCVGLTYSQCPAEFLECHAGFLEWKASKDRDKPDAKKHTNGTPYWQYDVKDARLARGWARRIRAGLSKPASSGGGGSSRAPSPPADTGIAEGTFDDYGGAGDSDIPF